MEINDTLISYGGAIKTLSRDGDLATIGARGIIFGSPEAKDLSGDYFTPKTYFGAHKGVGVDMMLNHGIPLGKDRETQLKMKKYADIILPPVKTTDLDDDGLLYTTVFNLRDDYQKKIYKMVEDGLLSSSSGAIAHAVRRRNNVKNGEVERWIIGEMSLTPRPCEYRLGGVTAIKSLLADDYYDMESIQSAIKTLTDESFSLNVPLDVSAESTSKSLVEIAAKSDNAVLAKSASNLPSLRSYSVSSAMFSALSSLGETALYMIGDLMNTDYSSMNDDGSISKPTNEERKQAVQKILDDYSKIAMSLFVTMSQNAANLNETKNLTDLTDSLPAGLSLEDHFSKVLAAVEEITERITSLKEMRCIKSERRWSADNYARLNALSDGLKASADAIKAQAEEYAPRDVAAEKEQRNKAALQAVAEYQLTLARLNGVSI